MLTIIFVGAVSTSQGLLPTHIRKAFATFNFKLFFPCLVLSTAASYDAKDLVKYSPLFLCSILHILLGLALGVLFGKLFDLPSPDRHFLLLMTAFNNNGGLPFILLVPLCETWKPALDEGPSVLGRAYGMITIYGLPWVLMMFTLGVFIIKDAGKFDKNQDGAPINRGMAPLPTSDNAIDDEGLFEVDLEMASGPINPLHQEQISFPSNELPTNSAVMDHEDHTGEGAHANEKPEASFVSTWNGFTSKVTVSSVTSTLGKLARIGFGFLRKEPNVPVVSFDLKNKFHK